MRVAVLMAGAALLGFTASPALASGGILGSSGNMGGLLGGPSGGHKPTVPGPQKGGQHGGGWKGGHSSESSKSHTSRSQTEASKTSGSKYQERSFKLRDTTIGGVYANPKIDASQMTKSFATGSESSGGHKGHQGGGHGGGSHYAKGEASKKTFSASFPVAVESTTIGGFSSHKASGSTWDNRRYSHKESKAYNSRQSHQSGGGGHDW